MLIISLLIVLALTGADQLIKYLIVANFEECAGHLKKYYTFSIGNFDVFSITHIRNTGAGWSILEGQTGLLLAFTSIVMLAILVYMIVKRKTMPKLEMLSLAFILAGGVGNLIDRVRMLVEPDFGGVVDYINFEFINFPVFNFADICVVIGGIGFCILCIVSEIKDTKKRKSAKSKTENAADGESNA